MERAEVTKKAFVKYVKNGFDVGDDVINLKLQHSLRVAEIAMQIANSMAVSLEDTVLAIQIGYLHDIGRFPQWTQFNSLSDRRTIDHGDWAAAYLKKDDRATEFGIDENHHKIVEFAIMNHNKKDVDLSTTFAGEEERKRAIMHMKTIRDADKLDNFELFASGKTQKLQKKLSNGVSEKVLAEFENKTLVSLRHVKSKLDRVVCMLAQVSDLNFDGSRRLLKNIKFADRVQERYRRIILPSEHQQLDYIIEFYNTQIAGA